MYCIREPNIFHFVSGADFSYIMKLAGKNYTQIQLSNLSSKSKTEVPALVAKKYYSTLTRYTVEQLQMIYKYDIAMHGYNALPPGW